MIHRWLILPIQCVFVIWTNDSELRSASWHIVKWVQRGTALMKVIIQDKGSSLINVVFSDNLEKPWCILSLWRVKATEPYEKKIRLKKRYPAVTVKTVTYNSCIWWFIMQLSLPYFCRQLEDEGVIYAAKWERSECPHLTTYYALVSIGMMGILLVCNIARKSNIYALQQWYRWIAFTWPLSRCDVVLVGEIRDIYRENRDQGCQLLQYNSTQSANSAVYYWRLYLYLRRQMVHLKPIKMTL